MSYINRMMTELNELKDKTDKLKAFMESSTWKDLSPVDRFLLVEQLEAMNKYLNVLDIRFSNITEK